MSPKDTETGEATLRSQLSRFIESAPPPRHGSLSRFDGDLVRKLLDSGAMAEQIRFLDSAVHSAPEGILVMMPGEPPTIAFVNDGFCRMSGCTREELIGQPPAIFRLSDIDRTVTDALSHPLCQRKGYEGEALAMRKDGSRYALELIVVPVHDREGGLMYWVAYVRDITARKAQFAALEHQVLHDVLTDLPNRVLLRDRLEQALLGAAAEGTSVALLLFDVDAFREVNDGIGYQRADRVLQQVAARVGRLLRPVDTLARLGGDDFAVLLPNVQTTRDAMRVAREIFAAFETPLVVDGQSLSIAVSIGVAVSPQHGNEGASLLRAAEVAMYSAKRSHVGYVAYSAEQETYTVGMLSLKVDLRDAIEQNQLVLYYQPKIHLRSGLVTRVEALVRWRHPEHGLMLPDQFIPMAEKTALIKSLTDWVLDGALQQCREWHDRGFPIHVAVNLPAQSLLEPFLPERISRRLERWRLEPRVLKLEITESSIMADPPHVLAILALLRTLGVRLSLDDFGTGYSSLVHMRHLPVDEIKIDKSFIMGMRTNESDAAIVRAIIELAHTLGHEVVAEGVDDAETFKVLSSLGCDMAQGYYLTPPLPAEELMVWLERSGWGEGPTRVLRSGAE